MVSNAVFEDEKEYLLPRNIIFELISKQGKEYTILAKPFKKDQFAIKTGCIPLDFYDVTPAKLATLTELSSKISPLKSKKLSSSPLKVKSKADSGKIKDNVKYVKSKRCPNGMIRNKITKECVPKQNIKPEPKAKAKAKAKLGRCPKGTRRNPKTLQCEAKL